MPALLVFNGEVGGYVEHEVNSYCDSTIVTVSAQSKAWYDTRLMLEWIRDSWTFIVTGPSILILDSLRVHQTKKVVDALTATGTAVIFVPGVCSGVAQPLIDSLWLL